MALIKILDLIIKGFEEFVYMITYFVLCASRKTWSYRWLVANGDLLRWVFLLCFMGLRYQNKLIKIIKSV